MPAVPFADALEARVLWAHYQIALLADPERADEGLVSHVVEQLGQCAFPNREIPLMFADVPQLVTWFQWGLDEAAELDEIERCGFCRNGRGNPCPKHD
ncbi:hypothetical protein [Ralstonia pseudosolanacearum]|uniref:hypothetical protein n=1 Tax=Ralstonia pseudosolanacearum TaxID=1310165 RepID=UPI003CED6E21